MIALFLLSNYIENIIGNMAISLGFFLIIFFKIQEFYSDSRFYKIYICLSALSLSFNILNSIKNIPIVYHKFFIFGSLINLFFIGTTVYLMLKQIFLTEKQVTKDTLQGGIVVYFFLGIFWAITYSIIYSLNPTSFAFTRAEQDSSLPSIYFSFITLTTLGYGDIVPVSDLARLSVNLEAIVGTMYPAIYIGRLVGLYTAQEMLDKD